eukprot:TRINITY_DN25754_c0_g1_i1.p1 TRINITY_DN25754_c0_g1~~TRINITY_DN25754_c0_g1_i1.p1  ORF type:complete len:202 (+),score=13.85 TRINITY_DN25754_c0_g1_i1:106-711(+)
MTTEADVEDDRIVVHVNGTIEHAIHNNAVTLYCRWCFVKGRHWDVLHPSDHPVSLDEGITQTTERAAGPSPLFGWHFPLSVTFHSRTPHGWPQLCVAVYGVDPTGKDSVKGYGWAHVPMSSGRHRLTIPLFTPVKPPPAASPSALWRDLLPFPRPASIATSGAPEFRSATFVCHGAGRAGSVATAAGGMVEADLSVFVAAG